jgi:nitrite reductase (cytochrome c-552)
MKARAKLIQDCTTALRSRALDALVALIDEIQAARAAGVADQRLEPARKLHRQAQWRADFVSADHSKGFHAPQEAARILSEAIDFARQGQLSAARAQLSP